MVVHILGQQQGLPLTFLCRLICDSAWHKYVVLQKKQRGVVEKVSPGIYRALYLSHGTVLQFVIEFNEKFAAQKRFYPVYPRAHTVLNAPVFVQVIIFRSLANLTFFSQTSQLYQQFMSHLATPSPPHLPHRQLWQDMDDALASAGSLVLHWWLGSLIRCSRYAQ